MFSDPYRGVAYFGQWAEDSAHAFGQRDALAVLSDAVARCVEEDMRTDQVAAALAYLGVAAVRQEAFQAFRRALAWPEPAGRFLAAQEALAGIRRVLGYSAA